MSTETAPSQARQLFLSFPMKQQNYLLLLFFSHVYTKYLKTEKQEKRILTT